MNATPRKLFSISHSQPHCSCGPIIVAAIWHLKPCGADCRLTPSALSSRCQTVTIVPPAMYSPQRCCGQFNSQCWSHTLKFTGCLTQKNIHQLANNRSVILWPGTWDTTGDSDATVIDTPRVLSCEVCLTFLCYQGDDRVCHTDNMENCFCLKQHFQHFYPFSFIVH